MGRGRESRSHPATRADHPRALIVTDGAPPWSYGHELTGYEVAVLKGTPARAQGGGVKLLVPTDTVGGRSAAIAPFPGGYIAELHATTAR